MRTILRIVVAAAGLLLGAVAGAAPITTLFNTGVDANGVVLPNGTIGDPHYTLISAPTGSSMDLRVIDPSGGYPFPNYFAGSNASRWIVPNSSNPNFTSTPPGDWTQDGLYVIRTTFDLTGFNIATAVINGGWAADNAGLQIRINGVDLNPTPIYNTFASALQAFSVTSGFVAGINTLDFVIENWTDRDDLNPAGLRVEMTGDADRLVVPEPASLPLAGAAVLSLALLRRRRR